MGSNRLEAFSDGVIAIIITIMVLELKVPHDVTWRALLDLYPVFISYVFSFLYVGIYWNNHHHLLHTVKRVHGHIMWANLHLLFWLSLVPFTSGWMGENAFADLPVALYSLNLLLCGMAYSVLTKSIIHTHGKNSQLAQAVGRDYKGKISLVAYILALALCALGWGKVAVAITFCVAAVWLIPDSRIEKNLSARPD